MSGLFAVQGTGQLPWFLIVRILSVAFWEWNFPLEWSWSVLVSLDRSICPPCFDGVRRSPNHEWLVSVIIRLVYAYLGSNYVANVC